MNAQKVFKMIEAKYKNAKFKVINSEKDFVVVDARFTFPDYDEEVECNIILNDGFVLEWSFGKMDETLENLKAVNDMNYYSSYYKLYLRDGKLNLAGWGVGYKSEKDVFLAFDEYVRSFKIKTTLEELQGTLEAMKK